MTWFYIYTKHGERFRKCFGTTDPKRAELVATNEAKSDANHEVKVIAIDDNGIKNEIKYK